MIRFENIIKTYGKHVVLDNLDLEIGGREFITIVGPSGAGKSTLLHALMGITVLDKGSITVDGYEVTEFNDDALQEYRRKVGMVFQDYKLLEKKTVYENVAFALQVCGWEDGDIEERVYEVLDLVGMMDHEGQFPEQLAGGEGQRTAIARALVHNPRLLIADEPTGNLDYWNAIQILDILERVNDMGTTVIMATHNRDIVDRLKRRVVVLNKGVIVSDKECSGYDLDLLMAQEGGVDVPPSMQEANWGEGVGEIEITEILEL